MVGSCAVAEGARIAVIGDDTGLCLVDDAAIVRVVTRQHRQAARHVLVDLHRIAGYGARRFVEHDTDVGGDEPFRNLCIGDLADETHPFRDSQFTAQSLQARAFDAIADEPELVVGYTCGVEPGKCLDECVEGAPVVERAHVKQGETRRRQLETLAGGVPISRAKTLLVDATGHLRPATGIDIVKRPQAIAVLGCCGGKGRRAVQVEPGEKIDQPQPPSGRCLPGQFVTQDTVDFEHVGDPQ